MLTETVELLRNDATLTGLLADAPWGGAAVYLDWAPEHPRPYITLSYDENLAADNRHATEGDIILDIWGDGTSAIAIEPIRDALFDVLDHVIIDTERGPLRFFYASDGPERDEDPGIVRWRCTYGFRRGRTEHVD